MNTIPRLAMINDYTGFGRCSSAVAIPIISLLQVQVCPVPTSVLSNHLAFPHYSFLDYTPYMEDYIKAWEQLSLSFDGLYCGFLGSAAQIPIVEKFLNTFQPNFFLLDPVLGDHGKLYSSISQEHCTALRSLLKRATVITPNLTEAYLLTDSFSESPTAVPSGQMSLSSPDDDTLKALCQKLSAYGPKTIVITGIQRENTLLNYIWQDGEVSHYETPVAGASRPGTGDIFASVLSAELLHKKSLYDSVKKAADFISTCIAGSDQADSPIKEGVLFEKYLPQLLI